MATFNILSSCICRDAFGFQQDNVHNVVTFLQATSALTWFEYNDKPKREIDISFFDMISGLSNFQKRCLVNDYNKTVLDNFTEQTDFFITDMTEFASMNIAKEIDETETEHYFTYSKWFSNAYIGGIDKKFHKIKRINHLEIITDEIIERTLDNFVQWIKEKGYRQDQIIIVEDKRATAYTDGELLYFFNGEEYRNTLNQLLDKIYSCLEEKIPNAYVVKMPYGVVGDINHKWGLTDLHFCKEYYDYLYQCFDAIATDSNPKDAILKLRDRYSEYFLAKKDAYIWNSFEYADGKQLLKGALLKENCQNYIAPKGIDFYSERECKKSKGRLAVCFNVTEHTLFYSKIELNDKSYYVKSDDCVKGYSGANQYIGEHWISVNVSTMVLFKDLSFIVGHNEKDTCAQTQIIQTLQNSKELAGKTVTFSVYARVLNYNNKDGGGTIALINADNYNSGKFYAKTDFNNDEWKRISVTTKLPEEKEFMGLTVCLRALSGKGENPIHATVEFSDPKLEISSLPTKY